ncbi:MAG: peptide deformylase [Dehalococcoidia bacterium]|nr:peptide deformylase [Dehalococcoidia bacterium]
MAVLPIRTIPDPVLRQKAKRIRNINESIQKLIDDMIDTMRAAGGVGLAANQVGAPVRLMIVDIPDEGPVAIINPKLTATENEDAAEEGCLSVPGYRGELKRYLKATIEGVDRYGKSVRYTAEGYFAQAFQHETDHLNGVLYIDRIEDPSKLYRVQPGQEEAEAEELASASAQAPPA